MILSKHFYIWFALNVFLNFNINIIQAEVVDSQYSTVLIWRYAFPMTVWTLIVKYSPIYRIKHPLISPDPTCID